MKRTLLASLLSVLSAAAFAQNYSFIDEYGSDVTFATQTYWIPSVSLDTREFAVVNNTTSTVTVKVRKTIISLNDPGATAYFCTDINCYGPTTSLSVNVTVYPGDDFLLTTDFNPDSVAGIAQVRYAVINQANLSDTTFFNIDYNITNGPASVRPNSLVKATITDPMPNPASSVFTMGYKLGTSLTGNCRVVIYNMLGEQVRETPVMAAEGTVKIDVSALEQGIYFCSLQSDGRTLATRRVVISH